MKTVVFASHIFAIHTLQYLIGKKQLYGIVVPNVQQLYKERLETVALHFGVPVYHVSKKGFSSLKNWLEELSVDLVLVFTFPYKIPAELMSIPSLGFYNLHFSMLPYYRGADPLFWQIKNGDKDGGITVHKMSQEMDSGPVLVQQAYPMLTSENYGMYAGRLSVYAAEIVQRSITALKDDPNSSLRDQVSADHTYFPKPQLHDFVIHWERQSALEIENLVKACNPYHGGATTILRGQQVQILEVTRAEWPEVVTAPPGTVIIADAQSGTYVHCSDGKGLKINIIQSSEGVFTGYKLGAMGLRIGEQFINM